MARNALVISGANFATNKLTTVTIQQNEKPCTAIALDQSTKTVTALGNFTLTPTVTPSDTTDEVIWTSSNTSVATVAAGVVSVVGLGTATVTATCGEQTATCAVTCNEVTISPYWMFANFKPSAQTSYPNTYPIETAKRDLTAGDDTNLQTVRTLKNQSSSTALNACPILLPQNAAVLELSYGSDMRSGTIYVGWLNTQEAASVSLPNIAYCASVNTDNSSAASTPKTWSYTIPSGVDSFAMSLHTNSSDFVDGDTPSGIATAKGIVIKCKPGVA